MFASETSETQIADTNPTKSIVITDADELEKMIEDENLDVPDGYVLEKVEINVYNLDSGDDSNTDIGENLAEPLGIVYTIKNVVNAGEYYFPNNYDVSDWYYGPATVSEKYSLTNSVKNRLVFPLQIQH